MEFEKGRIEKEKNIIIITPTGKEKSYKLDVNTGALYGLRGTVIATTPSVLDDGMKIAYYDRHHLEDKTTMLLGNFYSVLHHSDYNFNELAQTGILLTLDKIINAAGIFRIGYTSITQLQYIDKHFTDYVKYIKDETIYQGIKKTAKTERFEEWHREKLLNEKFKLEDYSECTQQVIKRLVTNSNHIFSDKEIRLSIGFCEHQLATFFNNDHYRIADKLIDYKYICDELQIPMKKGNFMMEYNAVKREYDLRKADIDKTKLQAKYAQHSKAWGFEDEDYMVVVPTCADDFITEGRLQHNCVGGYVDTVKNENSKRYVIFLRKKENPQKPVLTVEVTTYGEVPTIAQFFLAYNQPPNPNTQPELLDLKDRLQEWVRENW